MSPSPRPRRPGRPAGRPALQWPTGVLAAGLVLVPWVFWTATRDVFGIVKASLVVLVAVGLLAGVVARLVRTGRLVVPDTPTLCPVGAFLLLATVSTVTSDAPMLSVVGHMSRFTGLVLYLCLGLLFVLVLLLVPPGGVPGLAGGALLGSAGVAAYALLQWVGIEPVAWTQLFEGAGVTGSLGNPNYVAAHLAIGLPLALWAALFPRLAPWARLSGAGAGLLLLVAMVPTRSDQGPVAAAVGLAVLATAVVIGWPVRRRRIGYGVLGVGVTAGVGMAVAAALGRGPFGYLADAHSTRLRLSDWEAALRMTADHLWTGVGFDRFGAYQRLYRPAETTLLQGVAEETSAPHNVVLAMLSGGGLPLGLAYLAFVATIGVVLVRGLWTGTTSDRLLLGGVGGAWAAYQAQSMLSIDVPSLAATHWILAGAVVVVAQQPGVRAWRLPLLGPPHERPRGKAARARAARLATWRRRLAWVVGVLPLLALWPLSAPLRADLAAGRAARAPTAAQAAEAMEQAARTAPWEPSYAIQLGLLQAERSGPAAARAGFEEALDRDPRAYTPHVDLARIAAAVGDVEEAERRFQQALELEPHHPDLKMTVGHFYLDQGREAEARELFEQVLALDPGHAEASRGMEELSR